MGKLTKPRLVHDVRKLANLRLDDLDAIFDQVELEEVFRVRLKLQFATTQTEVHQADIVGDLPQGRQLIASITNKLP